MLYDRWRQVAQNFQSEIALHDLASGQRWTFAELASVTESAVKPSEMIVYPEETSAEFIFSILRAWRFGQIVFPLDARKATPTLNAFPPHCVHLKLTSASTGECRAVAFTAEQLAADARNIVSTMGLQHDSPNVGVISLSHSYGFSNLVLPLLLHGIPLALAGSALPENVRRAGEPFRSITLPAVPALWRAWLGADAIPKNVRLAISAGAPLPIELESAVFAKCGLKIHNFYGASECGGIAYDRSQTPRTEATLVGEPMDHVELRLDENGCLEVRGEAVGETYWPEPNDALTDRRFITSDLGAIRDGNIYLVGRSGDQINVAGRKVSPEIIETALLTHPEVSDALVFGIPSEDADRSEAIVACVAVNGRITPEHLKQFLLTKLPAWKVPREWWFVDSLQTNARGKRSRLEWRQNYLKNKLAGDTRFWAR